MSYCVECSGAVDADTADVETIWEHIGEDQNGSYKRHVGLDDSRGSSGDLFSLVAQVCNSISQAGLWTDSQRILVITIL